MSKSSETSDVFFWGEENRVDNNDYVMRGRQGDTGEERNTAHDQMVIRLVPGPRVLTGSGGDLEYFSTIPTFPKSAHRSDCCVDEAQEDGGEATKMERIQKKDVDLAGRTDA